MKQEEELKRKKIYSYEDNIMGLACFVTVISQLPMFVNQGISSPISQSIWIVAIIALLIKGDFNISEKIKAPILVTMVFMLFSLSMYLIRGGGYIDSSLFQNFLLSVFIFLISIKCSSKITRKGLERIEKLYVIATVLVTIQVYFKYLKGSSFYQIEYLYGSKNSVSVIIITAMIICFTLGWKGNILHKIFNSLIICFFIYALLALKCRAVIVSIPLVFIFSILIAPVPKKIKIFLSIILGIMAIVLLNPKVYDLVVNNVLMGGRGNLVDASSGRWDMWASFAEDLNKNLFLGDGKSFRESFFLAVYLQYGIVIGTMIIIYAIMPLIGSLSLFKKTKDIDVYILFVISFVYIIDAVFEELAPFGPGVRCFYLWMLYGIIIANKDFNIKLMCKKIELK